MNSDIVVSVTMICYNHERYIRQAIESVLMQKVDFNYEIVIGDDCSLDKTQEIIREYQEKYPRIIKAILRNKNLGAAENSYDVKMHCYGEFMAALEGDDYWTDEKKLQTQVDFLRTHPDIFSVAHRVERVDINGKHIDFDHKGMVLDRYFNKNDAIELRAGLFHTSSIMYRNFFRGSDGKYDALKEVTQYGGLSFLVFYLAARSDIYIFERAMSAYRRVVEHNGTNYLSVTAKDSIKANKRLLLMYIGFRKYFLKEYNFDAVISDRIFKYLNSIINSDADMAHKAKSFLDTFKIIDGKDIILFIGYFMEKSFNWLGRKLKCQ